MINKIINSEDPKFQSETISELVFDTTPTVNSFNTVTSDGVARAIAGASGEVPQVTENDNGKVLTAVYDAGGPAVEWAEAQGGSSYSAGDGIAISEGEISIANDISGGISFNDDGEVMLNYSLIAEKSNGTLLETLEDEAVVGIQVANPVPDTTGATSGDVLTIGQNGPEWAAPSGGSSGLEYYDRIEQKSLDNSMASMVLGPSLTRNYQDFTFNQRALVYTTTNGIKVVGRGYVDNIFLMDFISNGYIRLSRSGLISTSPTYAIWFPCTVSDNRLTPINTSIYLKTKTTYDWTSQNYEHHVYTSTGASLTWSADRDAVFPTPFTINGEIDTTLFDQVGDWSSVTLSAPWMWVLGFQNSDGNFITCGAGNSESNTTLSVAYPMDYYDVKIMSDGGLAENPGAGLYVTNPLPASTSSDEDKVLTVNSSGAPVWATPAGGGSYAAGDGIAIDNDEISALLGNSSGGMQFDNDGIAIDWNYMESSSDGTLEAISNGVGGTSGIKVVNPVPDTTGASSGDVLTIGSSGPEWAAPSSGGGGVYLAAANDMAPPAQATYSDVLAAYNAGNAIYAAYHDNRNNDALYPVAPLVKYDPINGVFTFTSVEVDNQNSGDVLFHTWWLDTNGWTDYSTTK